MQRIRIQPRPQWQKTVESQGLHFHTIDDVPYWDESAYYSFSSGQIDLIEKATYELDKMCLAAVEHVIANKRYDSFEIPPEFIPLIEKSWEVDEFTVYGRFDLAFDGLNPPKMLEYNADTPTALLEAAVIQWFWLQELHPQLDQFNSIHEKLIEAWKSLKSLVNRTLYFTALRDHLEDFMTVNYLRDTAIQAGFDTRYLAIEDLGWHEERKVFTDLDERHIEMIFKLYPWEWMIREQFGPHLLTERTTWLEPPWKMLLSNKAILPTLYELYPDSPYLLEASFEPMSGSYIRKPVLSREGANISLMDGDEVVMQTEGEYGEPYVYQRYYPLRAFDGHYPIIGSWMINGYACGMGIREDNTPITQNTSRFVPHVFTH